MPESERINFAAQSSIAPVCAEIDSRIFRPFSKLKFASELAGNRFLILIRLKASIKGNRQAAKLKRSAFEFATNCGCKNYELECALFPKSFYLTTIFTRRFGTTTILTICLPLVYSPIFASASASDSSFSRVVSGATKRRERNLPLT